MIAYKTAVAVKNHGYKNIKIYNGGLKDWRKSGYTIETTDPLPEYEGPVLEANLLLEKLVQSEPSRCLDQHGNPILTIVDFRTENFLKMDRPIPAIQTRCQIIRCLFDDLRDPEVRSKIPKEGLVIAVSETGNRDWAMMSYLYKWGYTNVVGLQFGMRAWIKQGYPIVSPE